MKIISQIKNIVLFYFSDPLKQIVDDALEGSKEAYDKLIEIINFDQVMSSENKQYLQYIIDLIDVYATDGNIEVENIIFTPE